jgi:integrase
MEITGPFLDKAKKGQPKPWYLRYSTGKLNPDGTAVLDEAGNQVLQRHRPYYASKAKADADKPRIFEQHDATGSGQFLFDRNAAMDYEAGRKIAGNATFVEVARFWRLHHPENPKQTLRDQFSQFLVEMEYKIGKGRYLKDLKSRVGAFVAGGFGTRYPETVSRRELVAYLKALSGEARTRRNHKGGLSTFFAWLLTREAVTSNPASGITKWDLPVGRRKEIRFLSLDQVTKYLRAAERYAPELVAHEVIQLFAGVRADDEMKDFRAEFVLPQTREVVIPEAIAKTKKREVMNGLEENFWVWWKMYGHEKGLLRPNNYLRRWTRLRVLASVNDQDEADRLAHMPVKALLKTPLAAKAIANWPWNARRRTFCTHHVAKYQSAEKTALILRHRGSSYTLHNSYRGLGVTQDQGREYFQILPKPVENPIAPDFVAKGIVLLQAQKRLVSATPALGAGPALAKARG